MVDYLLITVPIIITIFTTTKLVENRIVKEVEKSEGALKVELQNQIKQLRYAQDIKDMEMLDRIEQLPEDLKEVIVKQLIIPQKRGF